MAVSSRVAGIGLAVVATALTVTGVVLAATDATPGGTADPLALHGVPPSSAQMHVVISTGQAYNVTADLNVNFRTDAVEARVFAPMFFSSLQVDARLVHHHVYLSSPNLSSVLGTHWLSMASSQPSLYGLSLELTKPDISLISGFTDQSVSHVGPYTTYDYRRDNVAITAPSGLPIVVPTRATIEFSVTIGPSGEVTASRFVVRSAKSTASVTVTVTSYNAPAKIVAPPKGEVTPVDASRLSRIFGSSGLGNLLSPHTVTSLGQITLS
jgi:hypothetical protein